MILGIDVSKYQGVINWNQVAATGLINFAFCKASESTNAVDSQFLANWQGIRNVGLMRGAYHFAHTGNDPVREADNFIRTVGQLDPSDMLCLDIEVSNLAGWPFTNWVLTWLERVELQTGTTPILYTGGPFFNTHDGNPDPTTMQQLARYPLWLASYVVNPNIYVPDVWKALGWKFWQRSGDVAAPGDTVLHLPGIAGAVDKDVWNGTLDELKTFALNLHPGMNNPFSGATSIITG